MRRKSRLTEGGCLFCRKRRLRCDLGRPTCFRCQESNHDCVYGAKVQLKWVGGIAARGRLAASSNQISPLKESNSSPRTSANTLTISPVLEDTDLIAYFDNAVLPRFQICDGSVQLDLDAVMQDRALQQAVLAIARAHFVTNSKVVNSDVVLIRTRARHTAIESFRRLLVAGMFQEGAAQQLFMINVLLCMLDGIIAPPDESNASMCHLRGGFAILSRWGDTCARILAHGGMQAHLLSVFTTIDLNHAMLKGEKPFFQPVAWLMFANTPTWFGMLSPEDLFLTILKSYSEAACLGHVVYASGLSQDSIGIVERCLSNIERTFKLPKSNVALLPLVTDSRIATWAVFCSFYQLCGTIYVERALRLRSIDSEVVQSAVRQGVEMLRDQILPGMMSHCLIFPVLVFGSHCIRSQDRHAVFEALSPTSSYLSFGSLHLMTAFLQRLWDNLDTQATWWECFESISETAFLF